MTRFVLIAAVLLPATFAVGCGGPRHHGSFDPARMDHRITEHLDDYLDDAKATDAQRTRILAVKNRLLPEAAALATAQRAVSKEMAEQLASDRPDPGRLHALVEQQVGALRAFAHKAVDGAVEAHGTLSPQQRAPLTRKMRRLASR